MCFQDVLDLIHMFVIIPFSAMKVANVCYHQEYFLFWSFVICFGCIYSHGMNDAEISIQHGRFVEGMAPVFSRAAWYCTWHLIQVTFHGR